MYKTLMEEVSDVRLAPHLTNVCFVLPEWETAPSYKTFTGYFQIVEEYPKDKRMYVLSDTRDQLRRQLMEALCQEPYHGTC